METISERDPSETLLITGAAGFIGSAVVREALLRGYRIVALDRLTYAGNLASLREVENHAHFRFEKVDICDREGVDRVLADPKIRGIIHLAAESHVDRSIDGPAAFVRTNIEGTFHLLEAVRARLDAKRGSQEGSEGTLRFHHVSTDEVYGDLREGGGSFTEAHPYDPSSPYSASKAASDHLVRAWGRTYGIPFVITNCSNNYGPRQFPEKLIPHILICALEGRPLPVYGDGGQIRDWLYVEDHARALLDVFELGRNGETYNIGGECEKKNIDVVRTLCAVLEELAENRKPKGVARYEDLISFVADRPGHDRRYAIDNTKIVEQLGWRPRETFSTGIRRTVSWYLENEDWWRGVLSGEYRLARIGESCPPRGR